MMRRAHIFAVALLAGLLSCQGSNPEIPASRRMPNILFILIDALRVDGLSCYGNANQTSPTLDSLAASGIRFDQVLAHSSHTKPSVASLFTGLIPPLHGVRKAGIAMRPAHEGADRIGDVLSDDLTTLAELLESRGYTTLGVVTNPHLTKKMGFHQGFRRYLDISHKRRAEEVNRMALEMLEREPCSRFFMYLHYMDVHSPYNPPPEYADMFCDFLDDDPVTVKSGPYAGVLTDIEILGLRSRYDAQIRYWDDQFGKLLASLGQRSLLENTVIIVTSDHGEEFNEHGGLGHGYTSYEEALRVPLIVAWPGVIPEGAGRTDMACLSDILPTVAFLAGVNAPGLTLSGKNLFEHCWIPKQGSTPGESGGPAMVYSETFNGKMPRSLRGESWKLIFNAWNNSYEFYDLQEDPAERRSLTAHASPERKQLIERLSHLMNLTPDHTVPEAELDREEIEALKSLGYIDG
jgi:arylsulfatase A-like enzyme